MAPNAAIDHCYGQDGQLETFYMSNVCLQTPTLNRGIWATLEATVRDWANAFEEVWVFTGPIFDDEVETIASGVEIPDAFYKIIVDEVNGSPRVIAFLIPQGVPPGMELDSYLTSVDVVEQMTGFDFLWNTVSPIEDVIESQIPTELWTTTNVGPATTNASGSAGSCIFALAHVDARGECITIRNVSGTTESLYSWTISDGEGMYTFPEGVLVNVGETYTVCMSTYNPTKYTRGLYLNNKHDEVYLRDPTGILCDEVTW
jgi:hypothetical protein